MGTSLVANLLERVRGREEGWSLIETLVATSLLSIVLGAAISIMSTSWNVIAKDTEEGHTIQDARAAVYRMTRELRQGTNVSLINGYRFSADVVLSGTVNHVLWQCDLSSSCTRKFTTGASAAPTQGAGGTVMIGNVLNSSLATAVFTQPSSKFTQIQVKVKPFGARTGNQYKPLTFTDGFYGRNL